MSQLISPSISACCFTIFTARRVCIARTMLWRDVCLSVRLSVTRRYSVEMAKHILKLFHRRVATPLVFPYQTVSQYFDKDARGIKIAIFDQSRFISETIQHRAIVTVGGEYRKTYPSFRMVPFSMTLSEQIPRSRHYLTSNNSKMVQDTACTYNGRPITSRII